MKKRTLLGQILTVVIYLYNIAAIGLFTVMIAGLIGSNSIADKYGDTIDRVTGISSVGAVFTFISIGIVWIVFYFILKKIRDAAGFIDKESISNKKDDKGSLIEYFSKRKKNTVLFIALGLFNKVLIHFFLFRGNSSDTFSETFQMIFTDELILFIPAFLSLGFIVWYFNDKIKAK